MVSYRRIYHYQKHFLQINRCLLFAIQITMGLLLIIQILNAKYFPFFKSIQSSMYSHLFLHYRMYCKTVAKYFDFFSCFLLDI